MDDLAISIEAIREMRGLTTWVIGLFGAIVGVLIGIFEDRVKENRIRAKLVISLTGLSSALCILIILSVPAIINSLTGSSDQDFENILDYEVVPFVSIYNVYTLFYIFIGIILFIGGSIIWTELFNKKE